MNTTSQPTNRPVVTSWLEIIKLGNGGKVPQDEMCSCGRPHSYIRPHCRNCGSTNTYGSGEKMVPMQVPELGNKMFHVYHRGFRCRFCMSRYFESDVCEAPQPTPKMKDRRKEDIATESLERAMRAAGSKDIYEHGRRLLEEVQRRRDEALHRSAAQRHEILDPLDALPIGDGDPLEGLPGRENGLILGVPVDKPASEDKEKP